MTLQNRSALHAVPYLLAYAVVLPYVFARWLGSSAIIPAGAVVGGVLMLSGWALSAWCARLFVTLGRGTQSPFEPPKRFVVVGPYRYVRNPMILGNVLLILGEAALFASRGILVYAVVFVVSWHLILVTKEEPTLRRRFGKEYEDYLGAIPRWLPRLRLAQPSLRRL